MTIAAHDFQYLSGLVKEITGIEYKEDKSYLFETRFLPIVKQNKMADIGDLVKALREKRDEKIIKSITDAIVTNETYFFRDVAPFEIFSNALLSYLVEKAGARKTIRILSLGCSSGQEAYSLAMTLAENKAKTKDKDFEITGLDISETVLDKARKGIYSHFEVQRGLSSFMLVKYFSKKDDNWVAKDQLRNMTKFHQHNATHALDKFGLFDIVFCRNIMIYFDLDVKSRILGNIAKALQETGLLMIGATESIYGMSDKFKPFTDANNQLVKSVYCLNRGKA